ncbi:MAG: V-type ATP synthase subunit A [Conexivisphaerales archaeon]|jgi:V/A-type H+-transporting ATPase subunit A|nr:V-type ATP synthase subunit A [Conexivisphaerales archaeon]
MSSQGRIIWVSGPAVKADNMSGTRMYEVVNVGEDRLVGEVIKLEGDTAFIQVYESTSNIRPGEPVERTGRPLSVALGPGVIGSIFDGLQRPLNRIAEMVGPFVKRGVSVENIPMDRKWHFVPTVKAGDEIGAGWILGTVQETPILENRVLAPPDLPRSKVTSVEPEGDYDLEHPIVTVEGPGGKRELKLYHYWPVRQKRPYRARLPPNVPLITGQRILDTFFPLAKGGTAAIPGGFGTGKTVTLHQIASWADAKVVVYVGCGERGNEMTEVLVRFPELKDPYSGRPLMERTVLIANTSNMPVAAREASIYTGVTIAEYYRDMGYDVIMVADSTSRWAEALREISGRLEEMPAEEGFPSYLASRLAEFYERAGRAEVLGEPSRIGSVSLAGAVSPPGADFTEPVTTHTLRFVRVFWALDTALAYSRHYPAINWIMSYSGYLDSVQGWWESNVDKEWRYLRDRAYEVLQREDALKDIVRLLGPEALPDEEKLVLDVARLMKLGFLQQNAYDPVDSYASPRKQVALLRLFVEFYNRALDAIEKGAKIDDVRALKTASLLPRLRYEVPEDQLGKLEEVERQMRAEFDALLSEVAKEVV